MVNFQKETSFQKRCGSENISCSARFLQTMIDDNVRKTSLAELLNYKPGSVTQCGYVLLCNVMFYSSHVCVNNFFTLLVNLSNITCTKFLRLRGVLVLLKFYKIVWCSSFFWETVLNSFLAFTLKLPIQTSLSVAPKLPVSLCSAKNCPNFSKTSTPQER